ncbi:MAG: SDR family oxidoreductase [Gammaproteobacteria bacterium]
MSAVSRSASPVVLITGCNRGIGLELVRQYAQAGWRVYASCRRPESAQALNQIAASAEGRVSVHALDVTDPRQIKGLSELLADTPIDVLINNAGIDAQRDAAFGATDEERWLETLRVNVISPLKVTEAFIKNVARGRRRVVASLTSKMGSIGGNTTGGCYVYRSSKAALNTVMRSAAIDLRGKDITVVLVHPGWVKTDMGGPKAQIGVAESVARVRAVLDRVGIADSGRFLNFDGSVIPW